MSASRAHAFGRIFDGTDDIVVAGAPADVALELVPDGLPIELRSAPDHVDGRHDHARSAKAALKAVVVAKRLLDRMQLAVLVETLDRQHVGTLSRYGKHRAGLYG